MSRKPAHAVPNWQAPASTENNPAGQQGAHGGGHGRGGVCARRGVARVRRSLPRLDYRTATQLNHRGRAIGRRARRFPSGRDARDARSRVARAHRRRARGAHARRDDAPRALWRGQYHVLFLHAWPVGGAIYSSAWCAAGEKNVSAISAPGRARRRARRGPCDARRARGRARRRVRVADDAPRGMRLF